MGSQGTQLQAEPARGESQIQRWSPATRVAFRFCFVYFGLYCFFTQISASLIPVANVDIPELSSLWPMRHIVTWSAAHILRIATPVTYVETGSGDRIFDWVMLFCLLVIATVATLVWSLLDGQRENYATLYKWFRLAIRLCLAGQMFSYGLVKIFPLQMPYPYLTKLIEPFGNFSPMGVLWSSIGSSPRYEMFAGSAEMLGGILLIVPRTTMLGALVCLADMTQVFMLNMTYDVPVKLLSFHLILLSLFLLAPDLRRLANLLFLDRPAGPSTQPPLFATRRANRIALAAQVIFCAVLVGVNVYGGWSGWHQFRGPAFKSALYGIWDVDQLVIDGQTRSPLLTDYGRWRRAIFDFPSRMSFQRMDSSMARFGASIDAKKQTVALTKDDDKNWKSSFTFQRPAPDQLILDGTMDGQKVHMKLQLVDRAKFLLVSRGFHWVQEQPFNR
jgi:uncharacterized membrane protein YphA (DoxX/SURF4 family)